MKMMLVSGAKTEFDGRTKALIHIFSEIADLSVLSPSKDEQLPDRKSVV